LYNQITIPQAVYNELRQPGTPASVRQWMNDPLKWLGIHNAALVGDSRLNRLDLGEREAILLTERLGVNAVFFDEPDGRLIAGERNLSVIGTLQILALAAEAGLVELPVAFARLQATTFRVSTRLLKTFLDRDAERIRRSRATKENP
jgi:predicted nucleic acid-binding protein